MGFVSTALIFFGAPRVAVLLITALDVVLEVWIALFFGVAVHSGGPDSDIAPKCALFPLRSSLLTQFFVSEKMQPNLALYRRISHIAGNRFSRGSVCATHWLFFDLILILVKEFSPTLL